MEVFRILKPGTGWAQCIEFGFPYCRSENNSLPADAPLQKVNSFPFLPMFLPWLLLMTVLRILRHCFQAEIGASLGRKQIGAIDARRGVHRRHRQENQIPNRNVGIWYFRPPHVIKIADEKTVSHGH